VKRESKTPVPGPLEFHSLEKSLRLETTHYSADYQMYFPNGVLVDHSHPYSLLHRGDPSIQYLGTYAFKK